MRAHAGAALVALALAGATGCGEEDARPAPGSGGGGSGAGGAGAGTCAQEVDEGALEDHAGGRVGGLGEAAQGILGGVLAGGDPAVVAINTLDVDCQRAGVPACTGSLIGPDRVLTAAHCVGKLPAASFVVLFGDVSDPGRGELGAGLEGLLFRVREIRVHPEFNALTLAHDAAVLRLEGVAPVAPVVLGDQLDAAPERGMAARVVGFGRAEAPPPFAKREGTVAVTEVSAVELVYESAPAMTCDGDSGGPVFMTVGDEERLWGVTSRGDADCAKHGVAVRVDALPASLLTEAW
ncbi:S1 family peptidase [Chondromyces crocatus]|uniref:Peptidase S1 domain-containing protein n=1 Tax=Chondromyces crocatus TaxID=52 RepID=A0A0K1ESL4_CHOCO|nr:trypsin-like serine protease [Chondromyces crocatus]AKT43598.1 uncharacterized protein CMC5_078330 [Chondromyces crocatus]